MVEGCDGCIASTPRPRSAPAPSRQEAAEAIGVTFLMKGAPATIYGPRAYDAFCEFADALDAGDAKAWGRPCADRPLPHLREDHLVRLRPARRQVRAVVPAESWCPATPTRTAQGRPRASSAAEPVPSARGQSAVRSTISAPAITERTSSIASSAGALPDVAWLLRDELALGVAQPPAVLTAGLDDLERAPHRTREYPFTRLLTRWTGPSRPPGGSAAAG